MKPRRLELENWRETYKKKLVPLEEAAKAVRSGDNIFIASAYFGQVVCAIAARHEDLRGVSVEYQSPMFDPGWLSPGMERSFEIIVRIFLGNLARKIHDEGRISFIPYTNGTWFKLFRDNRRVARGVDVFVTEVSPPDENGFMTFGHQVWERRNFADRAKTVIAEIDANLIRSHGDTRLHVSQVDYIVDITSPPATDEEIERVIARISPEKRDQTRKTARQINPFRIKNLLAVLDDVDERMLLATLGLDEPDEAAVAIANHLKPLMKDGDTVQIGIGKPSKFVIELGAFDHLKDLGIFTEMGAPGMGFLVKRGIATGRYAALHPGKAVMASLAGMRPEEICWVHDNPLFELYSVDYVVNIGNIIKNSNMIAINNAIKIDLTGQITCESQFGPRILNGPGGQIEFHIGAFSAPGGRAVTLLASTWADGAISNITPALEEGTIVSIPRVFADYVVTEFGVAELAGKTLRERAEALIRVAHPNFRGQLAEAAKQIW